MSDKYVVQSAVEYLRRRIEDGKTADLPGMLNHVDYFVRVLMTRDEVQDALKEFPGIALQRVDVRVAFTQSAGGREITEEDMERNTEIYRDEFRAELRRIQSQEK